MWCLYVFFIIASVIPIKDTRVQPVYFLLNLKDFILGYAFGSLDFNDGAFGLV